MIKELINFTKNLENQNKEVFTWNINPSEGLHILLNIKNDGSFEDPNYIFYSEKRDTNEEDNLTLNKIKEYESYGRRIGTNMNKTFHKKNFSCNPFIFSFKKKTINELEERDFEDFMLKSQEVAALNIIETAIAKKFIKECWKIKSQAIKSYTTITHVEKKTKKGIIIEDKVDNILSGLLGKDNYINFYLESYPNEQGVIISTNFAKYYEKYLAKKGFNQDDENYKIAEIDIENRKEFEFHVNFDNNYKDKDVTITNNYGISDYLNGLNGKKPYLEHKTAMFQKGISQYIDGNQAATLFKFEQLITTNKILPNPLPIMIESINDLESGQEDISQESYLSAYKESIKVIKDKEIKLGFTEVLKMIFEKIPNKILSNFYLFNFAGGKLRDFDFVGQFQYDIKELRIKMIFDSKLNELKYDAIENVFVFERKIVIPLFNNGLVSTYTAKDNITKGHIFKYFDEIKESSYEGNMFLLVSKYRQAFYDYLYKSKREAINANMIQEILSVGIVDDILLDKYKNGKNSNRYKIITKLNLWFSLYDYFLNSKKQDMASKIEKFRTDFIEVIKGNRSLQDDEDEFFAFVSGQVVYYIQAKTMSADKSYSRLETFLHKTEATEFKAAIKDEFAKYRHGKYSTEFNNPFAQVNIFPLTKNMKDLLPFFLGGYFSKNLLFPGSIKDAE